MKDELTLYKPRELAERWRVTTRHIAKMARDGRLKAIRVGSALRIPASEIKRIESN